MVQVDLITGFLGAGKTTFLRRYAAWWAGQDVKVCVLENDFGAVNVDAMLLQDLEAQGVELETISGGCDCDTHQRRMRTKLISMAMRGFGRVIVEPSGIFDVDEFFDVLQDEPLDRWYALGNVVAIVDARLEDTLSPQAEYLLASEAASAGLVVMSRAQQASRAQAEAVVAHLNRALTACRCPRRFGDDVLCKDWSALTDADWERIDRCGWQQTSYVKLHFDEHEAFTSLYFLELGRTAEQLQEAGFEAVINAVGAHSAAPRIPGIDGVNVADAWKVLAGEQQVYGTVAGAECRPGCNDPAADPKRSGGTDRHRRGAG